MNSCASAQAAPRRVSALLAAAAAAACASTHAQLPSAAELEARGAVIRDIAITVDNVFDTSNPEEDKKLYRWANRVHVRTRRAPRLRSRLSRRVRPRRCSLSSRLKTMPSASVTRFHDW
jgi:hypothetical protein